MKKFQIIKPVFLKNEIMEIINSPLFNEYDFIDEIGQGSCGTIISVKKKATGELLCCKVIPKDKFDEDYDHQNQKIDINGTQKYKSKQMQVEVEALKSLDHPLIAKFIDLVEDDTNFYLLQELCQGVTLLIFINENFKFSQNVSEHTTKFIMKQIFEALQYIHKKNIAHRDLKPENILITNSDDFFASNGKVIPRVKIIDFGLASMSGNDQLLTTYCGSLQYVAPEIVKRQPYVGSKADMWSSGVILLTMLLGRHPFESNNMKTLMSRIVTGEFELPKSCSKIAAELVDLILNVNPDERISADEALKHPFFHNIEIRRNSINGPRTTNCIKSCSYGSKTVTKAFVATFNQTFNCGKPRSFKTLANTHPATMQQKPIYVKPQSPQMRWKNPVINQSIKPLSLLRQTNFQNGCNSCRESF